jgi:hypothetical protein
MPPKVRGNALNFVTVVEGVLNHSIAARACQNLVHDRMDKYRLRDYLSLITALLWASRKKRYNSDKNVQGLTVSSSVGLTKRLADAADRIEALNNNPWFRPNAFRRPGRGRARGNPFGELPHRFRALPGTLRDYTAHVADRAVEIGKFRKGPGRGDRALKNQVLGLVRAVEQTTGRSHYGDLGKLLSACADAIKADEPAYFDQDNLRQLSSRAKSRRRRGTDLFTPADAFTITRLS